MAGGKFITLVISLLFAFLALISFGFRLPVYLRQQILLIFFLAFISIIMSVGVYHNKNWAWTLSGIVLLIILINLFYAYLKVPRGFILFGTATFFSSISLFMSMVSLKKKRFRKEFDDYTEESESVSTEFTPGKYIASETGKRFHTPKCQWAEKINKDKAIWFDSEEEAVSKGYERDKCIG
ncbi:MAG: hypothetical protein QF362_01855 [Candidatus Woesearchaeota archaeon]|jgi:hypothetical protein|nr:hypothetical protein [Candidatus Woesearchaeota archaeon]MDP7506168.1 hypothetical protein [Candidatus Woesearchaeota archaeon]MDP7610294.1 hypothetical protein [Candidatus Woesearchaeota archaeon]|tara:strand:- start:43 stop:585 length:543 start_codon:yes stop_codon:yes gene_type:complete